MHAQRRPARLEAVANSARIRRGWCALLAAHCVALLGACSSGGSINLGNSQVGDPATVDFPIFYVKRPVPLDGRPAALMQDDLRILNATPVPGADLYMRASASPSAMETNITARITSRRACGT